MRGVSLDSGFALCALACAFLFVHARDTPSRISIGHFKFPLNDPDIDERVQLVRDNITAWNNFYASTVEYWDSRYNDEQTPSIEEEIAQLQIFANESKVGSEEFSTLLQKAENDYYAQLRAFNNDSSRLWREEQSDLSDKVLFGVEDEFEFLDHVWLTAYAGVGSSVDCAAHINFMLSNMTEWEKSGMAAASTLMALLPTFLAFGNL